MKRVIVIIGVSGCGKSSLGAALSRELDYEFVEADDFHSEESKLLMSEGIGLTDTQRLPWLRRIVDHCQTHREMRKNLVLSCSSLKQQYRELLRVIDSELIFIWIDMSLTEVSQRIAQRTGHFADEKLLLSQFIDLEAPLTESDCIRVDGNLSKEQLLAFTLEELVKA